MELSLERYRHAALPSKYPEATEDQRLRPRISPHLFPGSLIMGQEKSHYQRILNAWYGHPKQTWRLVYRASNHGYSASAFHRHCDGISPTYVIVLVGLAFTSNWISFKRWSIKPSENIPVEPSEQETFFQMKTTNNLWKNIFAPAGFRILLQWFSSANIFLNHL